MRSHPDTSARTVMPQPSAAYRQHHDVEAPRVDTSAFRQGWRVVTRLDALASEGAIDAAYMPPQSSSDLRGRSRSGGAARRR